MSRKRSAEYSSIICIDTTVYRVEEPALDYPAPPERYAAASGFFDRVCI